MTIAVSRFPSRLVGCIGVATSFAVTGCRSPADADPGAVGLQFRASPTESFSPGFLSSAGGPIVVAVVDERGQVVTKATPAIALTIGQTNGASLGGTTTVAAVEGLATFSDLSVFKSGTYTLTASSTGLQSTTSPSFVLPGGPCEHVAFSVQPTDSKAGARMASFSVQCLDHYGNAASLHSPSGAWEITVAIGANPGGATLSGTMTSRFPNTGMFSDIIVDKAGVGYTLVVTGNRDVLPLTPDTSGAFTIAP